MCKYATRRYTACGCLSFYLQEECSSVPENFISTITAAWDSHEPFSQLGLQRRFTDVCNRPKRITMKARRVLDAIPPRWDLKNTTKQMCPHACAPVELAGAEPSQCADHILEQSPRVIEPTIRLYQRDAKSIHDELIEEFGHFNNITPDNIWSILQIQEKKQFKKLEVPARIYMMRRHVQLLKDQSWTYTSRVKRSTEEERRKARGPVTLYVESPRRSTTTKDMIWARTFDDQIPV